MQWERPPERIRDLIRRGAEIALSPPPEWLAELDEATLGGESMRAVADDPVLSAGIRRTNRANVLDWATANVTDPGAPVPANLGAVPLAASRDLVRRGVSEAALDAYRIGQGVAWKLWMRICFTLTDDPDDLRDLLALSWQSISSYLDDTAAVISHRMQLEREELTRGTHAERREVVTLLLGGARISRERAEQRLGYPLDGPHTAAVLWSESADPDLGALDRTADAVTSAAAGALVVIANTATRWIWVRGRPDVDGLRAAARTTPSVRVAIGSTAAGLDGFRRSHLDALTAQRILARIASAESVATYDDVELVSLVTQDAEHADRFVKRALGDLETAGEDVLATVRVFIDEQCNASRTAARLYTHRNTVLRRIARAESLLPIPLAGNSLRVGVALEILRWRQAR